MNNLDMKNIIVLKDLPSNIIDEAIVILKDNNIKRKANSDKNQEDYINTNIVNEAQNIVTEYIEKVERTKSSKNNEKKILLKYKKLQILTTILGIMLIISFLISIIK